MSEIRVPLVFSAAGHAVCLALLILLLPNTAPPVPEPLATGGIEVIFAPLPKPEEPPIQAETPPPPAPETPPPEPEPPPPPPERAGRHDRAAAAGTPSSGPGARAAAASRAAQAGRQAPAKAGRAAPGAAAAKSCSNAGSTGASGGRRAADRLRTDPGSGAGPIGRGQSGLSRPAERVARESQTLPQFRPSTG